MHTRKTYLDISHGARTFQAVAAAGTFDPDSRGRRDFQVGHGCRYLIRSRRIFYHYKFSTNVLDGWIFEARTHAKRCLLRES